MKVREENIVRYTRDSLPEDTETDLAQVKAMTEEEIDADPIGHGCAPVGSASGCPPSCSWICHAVSEFSRATAGPLAAPQVAQPDRPTDPKASGFAYRYPPVELGPIGRFSGPARPPV